MNPTMVDGQVHGGVVQGMGQTLLEEIRYDSTGQLVGIRHLDMPATPMRVWQALHDAGYFSK